MTPASTVELTPVPAVEPLDRIAESAAANSMPSEAPTASRNHLEPTGRGRDSDLSSMSGFDILDSDRYSALTPLASGLMILT